MALEVIHQVINVTETLTIHEFQTLRPSDDSKALWTNIGILVRQIKRARFGLVDHKIIWDRLGMTDPLITNEALNFFNGTVSIILVRLDILNSLGDWFKIQGQNFIQRLVFFSFHHQSLSNGWFAWVFERSIKGSFLNRNRLKSNGIL